jgi:hypothetical protein
VGRCPPFGAFRPELPKVGDVHYSTILIFNPDFASTPILLVLIHFADLLRRIAMNGIDRMTVGISRFYEPTHMHVLRIDTYHDNATTYVLAPSVTFIRGGCSAPGGWLPLL